MKIQIVLTYNAPDNIDRSAEFDKLNKAFTYAVIEEMLGIADPDTPDAGVTKRFEIAAQPLKENR